MEERKIRVAITHGDTNGIGYEVILKAFEDPAMLDLCTPIIYGSPKVAAYHRNVKNSTTGAMNDDGKIDIAISLTDGRMLRVHYRGRIPYDGYY